MTVPASQPLTQASGRQDSLRNHQLAALPSAAWIRPLTVVAAGVGLYAASPPRELWWLAPLAFTLLALALHGRGIRAGFGYGALFGVAYLLPLLKWLYDFLGADFGVWPWLGLVALESLFFGLAGAGMARVSVLPAAPVWMAAVMVGSEALRSRIPYGGFPWGRLAFTQPEGWFLPLARVGGAAMLGYAVALTGCGLAALLISLRREPRRWVAPAALAALPLVAGVASIPAIETRPEAGTATVAVVQGNAPDLGMDLRGRSATIRANHIAEADRLVADVRAGRVPQPDLVIFPESSNRFGPAREDPDLDRIAAQLGVPMAVGGIAYGADGRASNRMIRWDPERGATDEYAKQQLVPFAEFVPLRALAAAVTPFAADPSSNLVPGDRPGVFDMGVARIGLATCYEVAYDYVLREATQAGANVLVVPTNNAWFGRTEMTYQQLAMARVRAVEHSRAVVVASTSGVSAIVRPDGTVARRTGQFTAETLVEQVPRRTSSTPATMIGGVIEWLLSSFGAAAVAITFRRSGRPRRLPRAAASR